MRVWIVRVGAVALGVGLLAALLTTLGSCDHDPNHGVDRERAKAAAYRVHATPPPGATMEPGHGG